MAFNPMNDFNASYQTATNVELARQEANLRAVETNSKIKAQNIVNNINNQQLEQLKYDFDRKQRENDVIDINKFLDAVQSGRIGEANWMLKNNSRLMGFYGDFGFKGLLMGSKEINPTLHQSTKEALARELGVKPEEINDDSIVYTQGDNGMPQAQYTPFWDTYGPGRKEWLQAKNYQTALQNLDIAKKTTDLDKTKAEAKGQKIKNEQDADKAKFIRFLTQLGEQGGLDQKVIQQVNDAMAAMEGKYKAQGSDMKPKDILAIEEANRNAAYYDELISTGDPFAASKIYNSDDAVARGLSNNWWIDTKAKLGFAPNAKIDSKAAAEITKQFGALNASVESQLGSLLSANSKNKLLFNASQSLLAAMGANVSPSDVGFIDDLGNKAFEHVGIDVVKNKEAVKGLKIASVMALASNARNNSYMSKQEFSFLSALLPTSSKSYKADISALRTVYRQNLNTLEALTRGALASEVTFAPAREGMENALLLLDAKEAAYEIDSDLPDQILASKIVKDQDGNSRILVVLPKDGISPDQDFSQLPDNSELWYTPKNGKLYNSLGYEYGKEPAPKTPQKPAAQTQTQTQQSAQKEEEKKIKAARFKDVIKTDINDFKLGGK